MLREKIVFGPIKSRRIGASLGINLLPENGKICNFDCVYCECGWNRDGRSDTAMATPEALAAALESKLIECVADGTHLDSITFSGDGEPTLNPHFPEMIDITLSLRDRFYPNSEVTVLTNATRISDEAVFSALKRVDNPILKLDAPTNELVSLINQPVGPYDVRSVVEAMKRFDGDFILQTMFLDMEGFSSADPQVLSGWMDIVRELNPRLIMVYTVSRATPLQGIGKYTEARMRSLAQPLINEGYNIKFYE